MRRIKLPIVLWIIVNLLLIRLALFSTPMGDDYCLAYGSSKHGLWAAFKNLNETWTPSALYMYFLAIWGLPISSKTIILVFALLSLTVSTFLTYRISGLILQALNYRFSLQAIASMSTGLVACFSFIQYQIYRESLVSASTSPPEVLSSWFQAFFFQERDGQILLWLYSTTLSSTRLILTCGIIYLIIQASTASNRSARAVFIYFNLLPLVFGLCWGLTTESLTLVSFIVIKNAINLINGKGWIEFLVLVFIAIPGLTLLKLAPGAVYRDRFIPKKTNSDYFFLTLAHVWHVILMLVVISVVAWITSKLIRIYAQSDPKNIGGAVKTNLRLLASVSILVEIFIGVYSYSAAYHWGLGIASVYFWMLSELLTFKGSKVSSNRTRSFLSIYLICATFLIFTLITTSNTASDRHDAMRERSLNSNLLQERDFTLLLPRDNLGNIFGSDIENDSLTIVPFKGYLSGASLFCYSQLPKGF
jgi:hypothetical protein